MLSKVAVSSS